MTFWECASLLALSLSSVASLGETASASVQSSRPVVCIDAGHPSEVGNGTRGRHLTELFVAWKAAGLLKAKLEKDGYEVVLTKGRQNEKVLNRKRAEIANDAGADLLIRLHCDAQGGTGFAVYYPDRQGKVGSMTGPSEEVLASSQQAAKAFHKGFAGALKGKLKDRGILTDRHTLVGSKQGALTGSIYSEVPVVLVEMLVLTNRKDETFLRKPGGFEALAEALRKGVREAVPNDRTR